MLIIDIFNNFKKNNLDNFNCEIQVKGFKDYKKYLIHEFNDTINIKEELLKCKEIFYQTDEQLNIIMEIQLNNKNSNINIIIIDMIHIDNEA